MTAAIATPEISFVESLVNDGSDRPATTVVEKFEQGFMVVILLTGLIAPILGAIAAALR